MKTTQQTDENLAFAAAIEMRIQKKKNGKEILIEKIEKEKLKSK